MDEEGYEGSEALYSDDSSVYKLSEQEYESSEWSDPESGLENIVEDVISQQNKDIKTSSASSQHQQSQNAKSKRTKKQCPECGTSVFHIPRHLRDFHAYTEPASLLYAKGDQQHLNNCPVPDCEFMCKRLDKHLGRKYSMDKQEQKLYCQVAKIKCKQALRSKQSKNMHKSGQKSAVASQPNPDTKDQIMKDRTSKDEALSQLVMSSNHQVQADQVQADQVQADQAEDQSIQAQQKSSTVAKLEREVRLVSFQSWLTSRSGGRRKPKDAKNISSMVFLSWTGQPLQSSDVANILTVELCSVGYQFRVNSTKLRKLAVTLISGCLGEAPKLAKFMKHTAATQQRIYDLGTSHQSSARMSNIVSKMMRGDFVSATDLAKAQEDEAKKEGSRLLSMQLADNEHDDCPDPEVSTRYNIPCHSEISLDSGVSSVEEPCQAEPTTDSLMGNDVEKSPLYLRAIEVERAVSMIGEAGLIDEFITQAKGYNLSGWQEALTDEIAKKNLETNKYLDEDAALQAVIKALQKSSESLTPREKIRVCMLVINHIVEKQKQLESDSVSSTTSSAESNRPKKLRRMYSAALKSEIRAAFLDVIGTKVTRADIIKIIHRKKELHRKLAAHHYLPLLSKPLLQKITDAVRNVH